MTNQNNDRRPDPKPRKHTYLWQAYLWWHEIMEMHKRHTLRLDSIEKGKSNMDANFEKDILNLLTTVKNKRGRERQVDMAGLKRHAKRVMIYAGGEVGEIWDWLVSIRGLKAGSLPAQLLAQIDDISKSHSVSGLWRFAGFSVVDGQAERNQKGVKSPFNRKLKGVCFNIADQFIRQRTPVYREIYDKEKARQYRRHPEPLCRECHTIAVSKIGKDKNGKSIKKWRCSDNSKHAVIYTPAHLDNRSWRKMIKIFLQHTWLIWRYYENLPISMPYAHDVLGHTNFIPPPNFDMNLLLEYRNTFKHNEQKL